MKVWWCEEHYATSHTEVNCWWAATWEPKPCRMVPMRLVPAAALTDTAWQFNEAVSLLREVRIRVALPEELGEEIDDGLPAMQSALEALAQASPVGESE